MSARREHGGGDAALESETIEAQQEEDRVANSRMVGWESRKEHDDDQD